MNVSSHVLFIRLVVEKGLGRKRRLNRLRRAVGVAHGRDLQVFDVDDNELGALITLQGASETEYWLAMQNFRAIMKYNPRTKYAMAVYQLAHDIARAWRRH